MKLSAPPITVRKLEKSFPTPNQGVRKVLSGLSFSVEPSERVAILGPSGTGKTTLLRVISGLEEPDEGSVRIGLDSRSTPHVIAMVSQEANLFPWLTVERNIAFPLEAKGIPREEARLRTGQVLETTRMSRFKKLYPSELSGGMKQRTAFARAIVLDPSVFLLDEPFGALDAMAREEMQEEFLSWWSLGRPTTVLITHSVEEAAFLADRVLYFIGGSGNTLKELDFQRHSLSTFGEIPVRDYRSSNVFYERISMIRNLARGS